MSSDPLTRLEAQLGYTFADRGLLERALMHASALPSGRGQSYQRMEFLGDRVLGLAVAAALYRRYPDADEGDLARRLNALVRKESCAERALAIGIDGALKLGHAEAHSGGRRKAAILADACEAVLAAVFLDGGFAAAEMVIARVWAPLFDSEGIAERDPKTALQELVQGLGAPPPRYVLVERTGPDHKPHFVIDVARENDILARGEGGSKREAEQNAARAALAKLGVAL